MALTAAEIARAERELGVRAGDTADCGPCCALAGSCRSGARSCRGRWPGPASP